MTKGKLQIGRTDIIIFPLLAFSQLYEVRMMVLISQMGI